MKFPHTDHDMSQCTHEKKWMGDDIPQCIKYQNILIISPHMKYNSPDVLKIYWCINIISNVFFISPLGTGHLWCTKHSSMYWTNINRRVSDVVIHDFVIWKIVPCNVGFTKFQLNLRTIQCFELSKSFIMDQFVTYRKRVYTGCRKRLRTFLEFFVPYTQSPQRILSDR